MASESERCVDELIAVARRADILSERLDSDRNDDVLQESKELLNETQQFIDNNKSLVPSYILKKVIGSLKRLEKQVGTLRQGKQIFQFNSKPNRSKATGEKVQSLKTTQPASSTSAEQYQQPFFGYRGRSNENLRMDSDECDLKDISLVDLSECNVKLVGVANTVYIRNLNKSNVLVCLACRAITITNCTDCTFKFVCQQLRIDATNGCSFSIFTSARSMLEASKDISFRMLKLDELEKTEDVSQSTLKKYLERANFNEHKNNWRCIDDFDWLSPDSPSSNYKIYE